MVKVSGLPVLLVPPFSKVGVTSMVAISALVVLFVAVNDRISPTPLAAKPIAVLSLVHSYVVAPPVFKVEKLISLISSPAQILIF